MHMADALLSPGIGGAFWLVSAGLIGYSSRKISEEHDNVKTPLMGVMGAFVFAAQMINFSIPGTGSSGHLGGGLLLAVLLGPNRAFIALSSVLVIQCLFFADGGLIALGCNIFNMAFFPAFVAYPFIFKKIAGGSTLSGRLATASICAAGAGLLMGAFSVVIQTTLSGNSDLPFLTFTLFMLPIHLAIGVVEGLATWGILMFVKRTQPSLLSNSAKAKSPRVIFAAFGIAALIFGGFFSWFASSQPDGLEWSVSKVAGIEEIQKAGENIHEFMARIQEKTGLFPEYSLSSQTEKQPETKDISSLSENIETSISGITGSGFVLLLAGTLGIFLRKRKTEDRE